jgi:hypothetical protein
VLAAMADPTRRRLLEELATAAIKRIAESR